MGKRYGVRKQQNDMYCVWDIKTDEPAEAHGIRHINYSDFEKAADQRDILNGDDE
jgi:hypothetical protein